jgi:hypothetical protein
MSHVFLDERMDLSFIIPAGPRHRTHSKIRVPRDSWTIFYSLRFDPPPTHTHNLRTRPRICISRYTLRHGAPASSPPTTRRSTVEERESSRQLASLSWYQTTVFLFHGNCLHIFTIYYYYYYLLFIMGRSLWREDGSVIYLYNCFRGLWGQSLSGRSPQYSWLEFAVLYETPLTWRAKSPYLYLPGMGLPSNSRGYWVPFSSPFTIRRARVEVF